MSNTRSIYQCLEHVTCQVTARGKEILKSGGMGLIIGASGGVTLGGLSVGFHDAVLLQRGKDQFTSEHENEYPEHCVTYKDGHSKCGRPGLDSAAQSFGLDYAREEIAKAWFWIVVGSTIGGATVGLLAGVIRGYCKPLPAATDELDLELQDSSYKPLNR